MEKMSRLKEELRLTEAGFVENVELLPKHTNSLPIKADDKVEPYKKVDVIIIPDGATNGDMLKAVFPDESTFNGGECVGFKKEWWNAPYKKEVKNE